MMKHDLVSLRFYTLRQSEDATTRCGTMNVSSSSIREARAILSRHLPITRLIAAPSLSRASQTNVYLKMESELPTGSFKPRGAIYALAKNRDRGEITEVVASSTGNHGAAVAFAAKLLDVPATIFLPENPNPVKRRRIAELGAKILEEGSQDLAAAFERAQMYARQRPGCLFLNDATDPDVPVGPATIGEEILEQQPRTAAIYVPMGDTALMRGIASAVKRRAPKIRIIGVQAERAPSYFLSWKQGRAVETETCDTIADGLATRTPDEANVELIRELVDEVRLVSEQQMLAAIRHLLVEEHVLAEPAGAAATAALLDGSDEPQGNVVVLVTGANIDPELLRRCLCDDPVDARLDSR
jgi:threonine dehydratase